MAHGNFFYFKLKQNFSSSILIKSNNIHEMKDDFLFIHFFPRFCTFLNSPLEFKLYTIEFFVFFIQKSDSKI